jgi:hypothetical protein
MPVSSPITILDHIRAIAQEMGSRHVSLDPDKAAPHGCEICQVPLTIGRAYLARFGTWRCGQCIGNDGFATAMELDEFRTTGITGCPQCGAPMPPPADISRDLRSYRYQCPACGATAQFSNRLSG